MAPRTIDNIYNIDHNERRDKNNYAKIPIKILMVIMINHMYTVHYAYK